MMRCEIVASGEEKDGPRENAMLGWDRDPSASSFGAGFEGFSLTTILFARRQCAYSGQSPTARRMVRIDLRRMR